ncbi:hypothetical protein [Veillonella sp.]|uniref:hypothetical protein n=1 Tax=Veillonella sp. TaxID=1926307 RepID=UPI0025ED58CC|nr:hypothetical protein [Veillonella sp.]
MNPGGIIIGAICFFLFYGFRYGKRKHINRNIWQIYLFIPLGILFVVISFLSPVIANIGFELGLAILLGLSLSIFTYYYKINMLWTNYSRKVRILFFICMYILNIAFILWFVFRAFIWWFGGIYLEIK